MRDFNIVVPRDCIASNARAGNDNALELIERVLKGDTTPSTELDLNTLMRRNKQENHAEVPAS